MNFTIFARWYRFVFKKWFMALLLLNLVSNIYDKTHWNQFLQIRWDLKKLTKTECCDIVYHIRSGVSLQSLSIQMTSLLLLVYSLLSGILLVLFTLQSMFSELLTGHSQSQTSHVLKLLKSLFAACESSCHTCPQSRALLGPVLIQVLL